LGRLPAARSVYRHASLSNAGDHGSLLAHLRQVSALVLSAAMYEVPGSADISGP
jgi:hypothetical protein